MELSYTLMSLDLIK